MIRRIQIVILVAFVATMTHTAVATTEGFYKVHLPLNVNLGMSFDDFGVARPSARKNDLIASGKMTGTFDMFEIASQGGNRVAYWYHFQNGTLEGVTHSINTAVMPTDQAEVAARQFGDDLAATFRFKEQQEVLRSTGSENSIVSTQLWENDNGTIDVYFLATNREITFVIFNPNKVDKDRFFVGPGRLSEFDRQATSVRALTERSITPAPLVDLLRTGTLSTLNHSTAPTAKSQTTSPENKSQAFAGKSSRVVLIGVALIVALGITGFIYRVRMTR